MDDRQKFENQDDGWFVEKHCKDEDGEWHTLICDYVSKKKAYDYAERYNEQTDETEGYAIVRYDEDFDLDKIEDQERMAQERMAKRNG